MEGREYELLLEKVFGLRAGSRGIDADMYQQMLEGYTNLRTREMFETQEERISEFKRAFLIVREQVQSAIAEGAKRIMRVANQADLLSLERMAAQLRADFFDHYELSRMIRKANSILSANGLRSGGRQGMYGQSAQKISAGLYRN